MYQLNKRPEQSLEGLKYVPTALPVCDDDQDCAVSTLGYNVPEEFSQMNKTELVNIIKHKRPRFILEIGVSGNPDKSKTSTDVILKNKKIGSVYIGIDLENKEFLNDERSHIHTIQGDSSNYHVVFELMRRLGMYGIDLLVIDGCHSVNQCIKDWMYTQKMLGGGTVVMHNINFHPGPYLLFEAIDENLYDKQKLCPCGPFPNGGDNGLGVASKKKKLKE